MIEPAEAMASNVRAILTRLTDTDEGRRAECGDDAAV
jgi:hypothetical protein